MVTVGAFKLSTAAGAVGSAVGQIAKIMGCRTIGIAGGATKVALCLDEFGYDAALDYPTCTVEDPRIRDRQVLRIRAAGASKHKCCGNPHQVRSHLHSPYPPKRPQV